MEFLKRLFRVKAEPPPEPERLPLYWRPPAPTLEPEPLEGAGELVGKHVVRQVLQKPESGRLVLADFEGDPDKPVLIKQYPSLTQEIAEDPALAHRLVKQLEEAKRVKHPLLYPLKAYSTKEVYLMLEVVPDATLQTQLEKKPLLPSKAVTYTERLLQLTDALHAKGLTLGEIRPNQIWLNADTDVRLLTGQWILEAAYNRRADRMCAGASQVQASSVEYLSPEVIRGEPTDQATDQYIIGAILFRLLTEKSVAGEDSVVLHRVMKIVGEEPPKVSEKRPELGVGFDPILQRMLARDAKLRYPSGSEIIPLLRQALTQVPRHPDEDF